MAKLHYYYASMNAGKSTTLLQSSYNYNERGMDTILFVPSVDTRYGKGQICSRIGLKQKAISFDAHFNFYHYVENQVQDSRYNLSCVLVDEAQFLSHEQVKQLTDIVDNLEIPVLAYGLRTDFRGEPFEGSKYLLALADELSEIRTVCHCGRKATMNLRVDENLHPVRSGKQIQIGGNELYISTCRKHYKEGVASASSEQQDNIVPMPRLVPEE